MVEIAWTHPNSSPHDSSTSSEASPTLFFLLPNASGEVEGVAFRGMEGAPGEIYDDRMPKTMIYLVSLVYAATFVTGVSGNFWVIFSLLRTRLWSDRTMTASERSRIYILILAMSDMLLLLTLPLSLLFIHLEDWILGPFLCHVHLAVDIFTKMFSVLILTAMSLERYFIVCTRWRHSMHRFATTAVPMTIAIVVCVLVPMVIQAFYTVIATVYVEEPSHSEAEVPMYRATLVCTNIMPDDVFAVFVPYTFIAGFAGPLVLMALCYVLLVRHVRIKFKKRTAQQLHKSCTREPRYMHEMKKSIWRIAIYHFVCWAPFWIFTISPLYFQSKWFLYCRLFANILPYINAAGNWILYAVLNYDVRKHIYSGHPRRTFFLIPSVTV